MQISKSSISSGNQNLIRKMQEINFGRIDNLGIRNGEAYFSQSSIIIKEFKPGSGESRPEKNLDDFIMKAPQAELLLFLKRIKNGEIRSIEVRHGLPFKVTTAEAAIPETP